MSVVSAILLGLAMGAVFGAMLEKSRVFEPGVIVSQMQLRSFTMLKIFLTSVATGLVVLAVLVGFGFTSVHPKATLIGAQVVGGLLTGAGIAIAGACPGTVAAQVGVGYRDAIATLIGGLFGALAYTYAYPTIAPIFLDSKAPKLTLDKMLGLPFPALALGFAAIIVVFLVWLEKQTPWRDEIGPDVDGLGDTSPRTAPLPAGAQGATGRA
jgi:hypothetical protein